MAQTKSSKFYGWVSLFLWMCLIVAGIVAKRKYQHPDWMMFFHLPAAVMLVMSFNILSVDIRKKYLDQLKSMDSRRSTRATRETSNPPQRS